MSIENSFFPTSFSTQHFPFATGSNIFCNSQIFNDFQVPRRRRDDTNLIISKLQEATWIRRAGERDLLRFGGRKNKNEILGLTNSRLIKEKYLNGDKYLRDVQLFQGFQSNFLNGEFVLVLRTDGRIVVMSDDVENHLGKTMRSLYTQCINIFTCLDQTDGQKLHSILNDSSNKEHRLVFTLRLPKGKRPSRTREDVKTIFMTGHFYSTNERLFVARCETLVSCQVNGSNSSSTNSINSPTNTTKIILNEDMTINVISSNTKDLLGYSRNEIIGQWFGRFLTTESLKKFQQIREDFCFHEENSGKERFELFDFYGDHGNCCLTFFCQIRAIRERRSKSMKYSIVAQLIDPSMRDELFQNLQNEMKINSMKNSDLFMVESPTLARGLLISDEENRSQQSSPHDRSTFSSGVAPFVSNDEQISCVLKNEQNRPLFEENFLKSSWLEDLARIDALINDF